MKVAEDDSRKKQAEKEETKMRERMTYKTLVKWREGEREERNGDVLLDGVRERDKDGKREE